MKSWHLLAGRMIPIHLFWFWAFAFFLAAILATGHGQAFTGDEPRYLMYAESILKNGRFVMTLPEWHQLFLDAVGYPGPNSGNILYNSVYLPLLLSPIGWAFSLAGLRAFTLLAGLGGLFFLFRLCERFASPNAALLTTVMAGLTIPLLPYLHIFYMETYLFALICWAWDRLQNRDRSASGDLVTAIILISMPFVHLRGSVIAATLYTILIWQVYTRGLVVRATSLIFLALIAFAILVASNLAIYGVITGPVNQARPPLPSHWFPVLAMQLFNVRHGLFAYAPVWLVGYAGLWVGTIRRWTIPRQGLVLAAIAAVTSVGIYPGECWPARFWVLAIPMLAVGFCAWWASVRNAMPKFVAATLIGFTLLNTFLFFRAPNAFIANRRTSVTYQNVFDQFGYFNFGLPLPPEIYDSQNLAAAEVMAIGSGLAILFLALATLPRRGELFAVPVVLLVAAALDLSRVSVLPPSEYEAMVMPKTLVVQPRSPLRAAYIKFGNDSQIWPATDAFDMTIRGASGREWRIVRFANQVIPISCSGNIDSVAVKDQGSLDIRFQARYRLVLYQSNSLLRNSLSFMRQQC
jgi:hypothetical protein